MDKKKKNNREYQPDKQKKNNREYQPAVATIDTNRNIGDGYFDLYICR